MDHVMPEIGTATAPQQPEWSDTGQVERVGEVLASRPPLVREADVRTLRALLADVAEGRILVVQAGDCAEDPEECTPRHVARKSAALDIMAGALRMRAHAPVLRVGRIGGQFAKPRSNGTERVGGLTLPVFRGHMVNGPEPTADGRRPDPLRILTGYMAASDIMDHLGWRGPAGRPAADPPVWTSHEALLLAYEMPMLRRGAAGTLYLGSTHWPWIGERTRRADGPHVALLAAVANPVACKIGPSTSPDELAALCERLDPEREPGRLTLIARMGADLAADRLPRLVETVRAAGHPALWLCDPMHGNTVTTPEGRKTRLVEALRREVRDFVGAVRAAGGVPAGLHLETTPDDVTECAADTADLARVGDRYTSHCDPRLTVEQATSVISAWDA
ncbi:MULTISPECIES: 3-deoxy-7-phosphoheptulonate synthase [Streptomyces]|uniref:Phospho-2-dehydro-3-deoxyheptonate aldolase n=2 Tax=Streptomyces TaxID=1883 RepID=A0A100Y7X5_9ACTN|nr:MULTISPECIES: 3-deoxy-7-phosphoheptulonate synthase [Streptomyces]KUH39329.1 phospho-2-dehydro-3-deoxyheptonate aldolase [Streptomyces kanasensis]UUS33455.1 3-deoxy-7-phosphoheptulonate synthase [Streptomyces changanensis]